jgi:anhydro-N-acetylmuramic acid kinase
MAGVGYFNAKISQSQLFATLMDRLRQLLSKKNKLVIGLMSGTSVDGIDAVLVRVKGNGMATTYEEVAFVSHPLPKDVKAYVLANSKQGEGTVDALCTMNILLAHFFADAVKAVAKKGAVRLSSIDLIGSHGQTVYHMPAEQKIFGKKIRATLQLGDPSTIAKLTGIPTVGDFRTGDMALGGEGAPLVPYFDYIAFRSNTKKRALLNIGGIANVTIIPRNCVLADIRAFDTGPGNMVIDGLMKKLYGKELDEGGTVAASGKIIPALLDALRRHPFFTEKPPKSTGREMFGEQFILALLASAPKAAPHDLIASATEFTAMTVYDQYRRFGSPKEKLDELIVSGGGANNPVLVDALHHYFYPAAVTTMEHLGFSSASKEAVCFAILANETISGNPCNVPAVTGASAPAILGKICL